MTLETQKNWFAPTSLRNSQFVPQLEATGWASRLHISRLGGRQGQGGAQTVEDFVAAKTRRGNERKDQSGATDMMERARNESGTDKRRSASQAAPSAPASPLVFFFPPSISGPLTSASSLSSPPHQPLAAATHLLLGLDNTCSRMMARLKRREQQKAVYYDRAVL